MKPLLFTLCLTSLLLPNLRAEDKTNAVELKHQSIFDAPPNDRDPFWPIGWHRPGPKLASSGAGPELTANSFALSSVTMGTGPHFAILNGKAMQEGQTFGLQFGGQVYQVTLRTIDDGQVILVYQENEIVVPLRRR